MKILQLHNLTKSYDNGKTFALEKVSFSLKKGSICAIVGESGSGKTTLVRLIAGLETPDYGSIELNKKEVSSIKKLVAPEKRNVGLVFQEYALFPHLTVYDNIVYGISKRSDKKNRVREVLDLVGLNGFENRYPHQLSGGQQQRVALARAMAPKPELLILDEPFSNLDEGLKAQLRNELFSIIKEIGITALFITHDTQDALAIADEIIILKEGHFIQKGTAKQLYKKPKNHYIAGLFGFVNKVTPEFLNCFDIVLENNSIDLGIRSTDIFVSETKKEKYILKGTIVHKTYLGEVYEYLLKVNNMTLEARSKKNIRSEKVYIKVKRKNILMFDN